MLVKRVGKTKERGGKWEEMGCVTALVRDMIISSSIKRTVGGSSHEREKERESARARARERERKRERERLGEREREQNGAVQSLTGIQIVTSFCLFSNASSC